MGKSVCAAVAAAFILGSCQTVPPAVLPAPAKAPAPAAPAPELRSDQPWKPVFPPKPLTLLYTTFQNHAVLQRDKSIPVWGVTSPSAQVDVTLAGASAHATADADGNWRVEFPAMKAGGPYALTAKASTGETQSVADVMIGDVYLCSGQSNMEMPLRLATNYDSEMWAAKNPAIRLFHVQRFTSPTPRSTFGADASWSVTSPETVKEFSAVCYYFGRELQPVAGVPIGLIEDAWGGAAIQAWMSDDALRALGGYDEQLGILKSYAGDPATGQKQWLAMSYAWWKAHDPALSAAPAWSDPAHDDFTWGEAAPKGILQQWGRPDLKTVNGIVWLRKSFSVTAAQAAGSATLNLGPVWESDTTWVNGVNVGAFDSYDVNRVYQIPAGTLHEGKNLLAVGLIAGVGLLASTEQITVKFADGSSVALTGAWKYKLSAPRGQTGRTPYVPWLNQFGVSTLYNGMIAPLGDTKIRGIVWYQGETDAW
jgi:sialate O-acetylesterase